MLPVSFKGPPAEPCSVRPCSFGRRRQTRARRPPASTQLFQVPALMMDEVSQTATGSTGTVCYYLKMCTRILQFLTQTTDFFFFYAYVIIYGSLKMCGFILVFPGDEPKNNILVYVERCVCVCLCVRTCVWDGRAEWQPCFKIGHVSEACCVRLSCCQRWPL